MSSFDLKYNPDEVIVSVGFFAAPEIKYLYKKTPPKYLEAYDPRPDVYTGYLKLRVPNFEPILMGVLGEPREAYLNLKKASSTLCLPHKSKQPVETVSLTYVTNTIVKKYGIIDRLLMNCEGSEIDIIQKTPSKILGYYKYILVSFHLFAELLNISDKDYKDCLDKLSLTHTGELRHKTRFWWEFRRNG